MTEKWQVDRRVFLGGSAAIGTVGVVPQVVVQTAADPATDRGSSGNRASRQRGALSPSNQVFDADQAGVTSYDDPTAAQAVSRSEATANSSVLNAIISQIAALGQGRLLLPRGYVPIYGALLVRQVKSLKFGFDASQIVIEGHGPHGSQFINLHPTDACITVAGDAAMLAHLKNFGCLGKGRVTLGNHIEVVGQQYYLLENLWLAGTAGSGFVLAYAERGAVYNVDTNSCRRGFVIIGNGNETYLYNVTVINCGQTRDFTTSGDGNYQTFNINAPLGAGPNYAMPPGKLYQEKRGMCFIGGTINFSWDGGSVKTLRERAGLQYRGSFLSRIKNIYFEGYNTDAIHPTIIVGGAMMNTTLTEEIASGVSPSYATPVRIGVADSYEFIDNFSSFSTLLNSYAFRPESNARVYVAYNPADPAQFEFFGALGHCQNQAVIVTRNQTYNGIASSRSNHTWPAGTIWQEVNYESGELIIDACHTAGGGLLAANWLYADPSNPTTYDGHVAAGDTNGVIIAGWTWDAFNDGSRHLAPPPPILNFERFRAVWKFGPGNGDIQSKIQVWNQAFINLSGIDLQADLSNRSGTNEVDYSKRFDVVVDPHAPALRTSVMLYQNGSGWYTYHREAALDFVYTHSYGNNQTGPFTRFINKLGWQHRTGAFRFTLDDQGAYIERGQGTSYVTSLKLDPAGNIASGLGTGAGLASVHVQRTNADATILLDAQSKGAGSSALRLVRNGSSGAPTEEIRFIAAGGSAAFGGLNEHYAIDIIGTDSSTTRKLLIRSSRDGGGSYATLMTLDPVERSASFSGHIQKSVSNNQVAKGRGRTDAAVIVSDITVFTLVPVNCGAILPPPVGSGGLEITIFNRGESSLKVYPNEGARIDALAANAAYYIASGEGRVFCAIGGDQWLSK